MINPDEFIQQLDETRADEYIPFLEDAIETLAEKTEGTRMIFRVNQLESMLEQGLEKRICQAKGIPVIEDISRRAA
jgi:hypothetical protein